MAVPPPVSQVVPQLDIHITYVDKEGPFIKIFAQTEKKNALMVERCLYQLSTIFDSPSGELMKPKAVSDIKVGLLCCAKFEDGVYYRARIDSVGFLKEYLRVSVTFMDHGNHTVVNVSDIRLMSKVVQYLTPDARTILTEHDALAMEYFLSGISPPEREWDKDTIDFLKKKLSNQDVKCSVFELCGKKIMKILDSEVDPVGLLVSANKAFPIPMQTQERMIKSWCKTKSNSAPLHDNFSVPPPSLLRHHPPPMTKLTSVPNPILSQPPPNRFSHEANVGLGIRPQSVVGRLNSSQPVRPPGIPGIPMKRPEAPSNFTSVQSLQFSTEMLAPGSAHPIFVSHVEDGPHAFTVQLQSVVQETLMIMMAELNNLEPEPITAPLNPGSICLGRFLKDGTLCRAIVTNVLDDKVKLYFADFGNSEILPYSNIYQIPPQYVTPKVMSHRFTLANIKDIVYSDHEKQIFKDLVSNSRELFMKVTPPEANPLKQYCELFVNFKNIKTILQEKVQSQPMKYTTLPLPARGSREKVTVAYVVHPGRFFVQLEKSKFALNNIMKCVAKHCEQAPLMAVNRLRPNEPCCALFDDNTWYRAEIQSVQPEGAPTSASIMFVDYGNVEAIPVQNLRQTIPQLVTTVKAQALWCCLKGFELRYDTSEELSNKLEEMILEQSLTMEVIAISNDTNVLIVDLTDERGQSIGAQLAALLEPAPAPPQPAFRPPAPAPVPTPIHHPAKDEWEETPSSHQNNSCDNRKHFESRGQGEDKKPWRYQEDGGEGRSSRFNKEGGFRQERRFNDDSDEKPWNKSREERGGRFNQNEDGGSRFNREDKKYGSGRFQDEDRGSRFSEERGGGARHNREDGGAGGRFNRDDGSGAGRFTREDRGASGRFNREEGDAGGRFNRDDGGAGGRFNRDDRGAGGRFNKGDESSWRKKEDGGGSWRSNKDEGSWKDAAPDRKSRFESDSGGFKRGGYGRENQEERSSFQKPWEKGGGDSSRKPQQKPKQDTWGGIPYSTAKVGMVENSQVVFTTSTSEFYCQLSCSFDELNDLMEKIATACDGGTTPDLTNLQEKVSCLAKYSEDDSWYRGYIEEKGFDSAKVLFVDYGNREDVPFDKLKVIPEDMCTLPVQAIKCQLFGVPESADTETFKTIVSEKSLKTHFVGKCFSSNSFEVVLLDEDGSSNVNALMGASEEALQIVLSKLGSVSLAAISLSPGSSFKSQVTWYVSPAEFYVQPLDSNSEFRAMMTQMQKLVRTGTPKKAGDLNVGDYIIARFKTDKVLYRACVKETGFTPLVQFVDFGNSEPVEINAIWAMEPEFACLPAQAINCYLDGVTPVAETWPKLETSELDAHFDAESLECTVLRLAEDETETGTASYPVKLAKNGADVAESIIAAGFALAATASGATPPFELDSLLLIGQLLSVTLLRVDSDLSFFVKPSVEGAELTSLEAQSGAGVKCSLSSIQENMPEEQKIQFLQLPANSLVIIRVDSVLSDGLQVTLYDAEGKPLPLQGLETPPVDSVCPLPVLNTHQTVYISHADDTGIYLHKTSAADALCELLQKLFDFYNDSAEVNEEWKEGDLCCALSANDGQWYRAKILEAGLEVNVLYLDYGNSETLPAANLRKLDSAFYTPHAFALKVVFHMKWTVPVSNLLELAGETEYNGVVLRKSSEWVAELVDTTGQNLSEKLVELEYGVALENSPFKRIVEGGRFVKGTVIHVTVHCIDSPLQLWVNVMDDVELVDALQDRLQDVAPKLPSLKEPVGIFAVKYSDGHWYRAVKLDDTTVKFIDYGNTYTIDMGNIKTLSPDFLDPTEGYSIKVELPIVNYSEEATKKLSELLYSEIIDADAEEEITAHILSVKDKSIVADIFKGKQSVLDTLIEESLGARVYKDFSGFVSHINNLNDFFVQELGCEEDLDNVASVMLTAEHFETHSEVSVGDIVAALFPNDGLWYRAKVIKTSDEGMEVIFIDYGNSAVVSDIRELPKDLSEKPALCIQCALLLPDDVHEWSEQANKKFVDLAAEGCTPFNVKTLNEETPTSVILSVEDELVAKSLVSESKNISECVDISPEGNEITVYISHINTPNDFYVQSATAEAELETMRAELVDASSFKRIESILDEVSNQTIVAALFNEDELWYRAKLLNTVENGFDVLFVDYGNTAIANEIKTLPEQLQTKDILAIHCSLCKKGWSNAACEYFTNLSGEGSVPFQMKIIGDNDPKIVNLAIEGKTVEEQLVCLFGEPSLEIKSVTETDLHADETNLTKNVFLIQVFSPSDFYVHTAEATQQLGEISEQLIAAEDFSPADGTCSVGDTVAAQFDEDDLWYRAKVLELCGSESKVLFVDYGNTAKVSKMKNLSEELVSIPALAMHCTLQTKSNTDEWPVEACEKLRALANDDSVSFDMKTIKTADKNVVELFINGESVSLLLGCSTVALDIAKESGESGDNIMTSAEETINFINGDCKSEDVRGLISFDSSKDSVKAAIDSLLMEATTTKKDIENEGLVADSKAVKICHFNTCYDFCVQRYSHNVEFKQIVNEMSEADNFETMLDDDVILAAKNEDGLWCRAKIIHMNSEESTVLFVDFGYIGTSKCFRKLPKHLIQIKPQAFKCCLKVPSEYEAIANDIMTTLARDDLQVFDLVILEEKEPCVIDLMISDNSLTELIVEKAKMAGGIVSGIIENINSTKTDSEFVEQIIEELVENATQCESSSQLLANSSSAVESFKEVEQPPSEMSSKIKESSSSVTNATPINDIHELTSSTTPVETSNDCISNDLSVSHQEELLEDCYVSNAVLKDNNNSPVVEKKETVSKADSDVDTESAKLSPPTPRRSNIDEHIVPGCISSLNIAKDLSASQGELVEFSVQEENDLVSCENGEHIENQKELINDCKIKNGELKDNFNRTVVEKKETEAKVESNDGQESAKLTPPTPRRSNIEEHIVPGCISASKIAEDAE